MTSILVLNHYLVWHYSIALRSLFQIWKNLLWFTVNFFSIVLLLKSLFSPWKRMTESKGRGWDFEAIAGAIVINIFSRLVGAVMRTAVILIGLMVLIIEILSIGFIYAFWLLAPGLIVILFIWGILMLF